MIIGLLKERKTDENRVALVPKDVKKLIDAGHEVIFEWGCGINAGFTDSEYIEIGADPKKSRELFRKADIICKVKTPQDSEPKHFHYKQTLFSYLHYDGNESLEGAEQIRKSGAIAIAFEWVKENHNYYPLLSPMSEFTGIIGATKIIELYRKKSRRIAGDFSKYSKPATVMVIGVGTIGANALNVFLHHGLNIIIVDKHPKTLKRRILKYIPRFLWENCKKGIKIIKSDELEVEKTKNQIRKYLPQVDILFFSAVRRPNFKEPHLIDKDMLKIMKKNSFLIDAAANDHDLVETIQSYPEIDKIYKVHDVWHYANDHIPTMAAYHASIVLSKHITPYLLELANKGSINAILENNALYEGCTIAGMHYTHKYTCLKRGLNYMNPKSALGYYRNPPQILKNEIEPISNEGNVLT